jgi:hypothetical protein
MKMRKNTLLGISFDKGLMTVVRMRIDNGAYRVDKALRVPLSLDPVSAQPELVGRAIRERLTENGISDRDCLVVLPVASSLSMRIDVPNLAGQDLDDYIRMQSERQLPVAIDDMSLAVSYRRISEESRVATVVAVPLSRLSAMQRALQGAHLRPVGFTIGICSIAGAESERMVTLLAHDDGIDLSISDGSYMDVLRHLSGLSDSDSDTSESIGTSLARQVRISLGQISPDLRQSIRRVRILGRSDLVRRLSAELTAPLESIGLTTDASDLQTNSTIGKDIRIEDISPELITALYGWMHGTKPDIRYAPPLASALRRITGHVSSRGVVWLGGAAIAALLLTIGLFSIQQILLSHYESKWNKIASRTKELEDIQNKVRFYRPWFDKDPATLAVLKTLTENFPTDGSVWAVSILVQYDFETDKASVECSAKAKNDSDWQAVFKKLREAPGVVNLAFQQLHGENPLQFTLHFNWETRKSDG